MCHNRIDRQGDNLWQDCKAGIWCRSILCWTFLFGHVCQMRSCFNGMMCVRRAAFLRCHLLECTDYKLCVRRLWRASIDEMQHEGILLDVVTLIGTLKACSTIRVVGKRGRRSMLRLWAKGFCRWYFDGQRYKSVMWLKARGLSKWMGVHDCIRIGVTSSLTHGWGLVVLSCVDILLLA